MSGVADKGKFQTYQDFYDDFKKCRSAAKGRPIKGWCRLFKDGRDFVVKQVGWRGAAQPLFRISPDNTVTFEAPANRIRDGAQTLVSSLYRVVPITIERKRKGIYIVGGLHSMKVKYDHRYNAHMQDWIEFRKRCPEYFNGIQFNLLTGECLNPQPNVMDTVIPEKRTQWLSDVKRYKKGLKIRAKVGAFDAITVSVADERANASGNYWEFQSNIPKWDDAEVTQHVLECMKTEVYPADILR